MSRLENLHWGYCALMTCHAGESSVNHSLGRFADYLLWLCLHWLVFFHFIVGWLRLHRLRKSHCVSCMERFRPATCSAAF